MISRTFRNATESISLFLLVAPIALAVAASPASAAGWSGACVSARIDAPFRLPDGSVHAAGTLMLCEAIPYSPVASVHRTYVDSRPVGMFVSKIRRTESVGRTMPSVVLQRDGDGPLQLLGYVRSGHGRNVSYQFSVGRSRTTAATTVLAGTAGPLSVVAAAQ